jgi:hypothetical protein
MPLSRNEVRANLTVLLQYQAMRDGGHGPLELAVWRHIEDEAQDVHLLEVFERFAAPDGAPSAALRFPGMGNMWLPGLYHIEVFSRAEFERLAAENAEPVASLRRELAEGTAEIIAPVDPASPALARLLRPSAR